jgi:hypothetical protein
MISITAKSYKQIIMDSLQLLPDLKLLILVLFIFNNFKKLAFLNEADL